MYLLAKRLFDLSFSFLGLIITSPILLAFIILVYLEDKSNPFYISIRVGQYGKDFKIFKLRTMITNADTSGVDSTSVDDERITSIGYVVRKYKLDEMTQLVNVLIGNMSFVGPRPNVHRDVAIYSKEEKKILNMKPGITDFSSIVFSDEGEILQGTADPDLVYNQIIRPWKSRLCLLYAEKCSLALDIKLIYWTLLSFFSKSQALKKIVSQLEKYSADKILIEACTRERDLVPYPPPGILDIVKSRNLN